MRNTILLLLFIFSSLTGFAQINSETYGTTGSITDSTALTFCEVMPTFTVIGYKSFEDYLAKHIMYPSDAKTAGVSGTVYVEFIIEKDGSVSNVKILNGRTLYPSCDKEAIRVISASPKWTPGKQNGKTVRVKKVSRIAFKL